MTAPRRSDAARLLEEFILVGPGVSNETTAESYGWDGRRRLIRAEDNDSVLTYTHDSLSQTTSETVLGRTVSSTYDGAGNRTRCTYPGGRVITADYDAYTGEAFFNMKSRVNQAIFEFSEALLLSSKTEPFADFLNDSFVT